MKYEAFYDSDGHRMLREWLAKPRNYASAIIAACKGMSDPASVSRLKYGAIRHPSLPMAVAMRGVCGIHVEAWLDNASATRPSLEKSAIAPG
jgi:hypothetical protein